MRAHPWAITNFLIGPQLLEPFYAPDARSEFGTKQTGIRRFVSQSVRISNSKGRVVEKAGNVSGMRRDGLKLKGATMRRPVEGPIPSRYSHRSETGSSFDC
jgi:hypothetical protein